MKRVFKLTISLILFPFIAFLDFLGKTSGLGRFPAYTIIYYHNIPDAYSRRFHRQMRRLRQWTVPVLPSDVSEGTATKWSTVTFDDGFVSYKLNAVPVMEALGIPSIVFVPTDSIGIPPNWTEDRTLLEDQIMTVPELSGLPADISVVGSHGVHHVRISALDAESARSEIQDSKTHLEHSLGKTVRFFSFPHGMYSSENVGQAREAGYRNVFSIDYRWNRRGGDENFILHRVKTDPWDWSLEFFLKVHGAYVWQSTATNLKRFLVRGRHGVPGNRSSGGL